MRSYWKKSKPLLKLKKPKPTIQNNHFMKKAIPLAVILVLLLSISTNAQEADKEEIPPGMERLEMGAARVVVPIGTRVRKVGSLIILEDDSEYMSRRFLEMEQRLAELEEKEAELKKEVEKLKSAYEALQEEKPNSEQEE